MRRNILALVMGFLLFAGAAPAQLVGSPYWFGSGPTTGLLQFGANKLTTQPNPFLTSLTPIHTSIAAWLFISTGWDVVPWPFDPAAGWLLVDTVAPTYIGTVTMGVSASTVEWFYRWDLPPDPSLSGTVLYFQAAKIDAAGAWTLTNGWATPLIP